MSKEIERVDKETPKSDDGDEENVEWYVEYDDDIEAKISLIIVG